jgi:predicted kinase
MLYVNPDDYLGDPRVFTPERNREAWRACRELIERTFAATSQPHNFYIVCGIPGAGKTRWVKENLARFEEPAIVLDAVLTNVRARENVVAHGKSFPCRLIGIWISCALDVALARNRARAPDQAVPDELIRTLFGDCERPNLNEGFDEVLEFEAVGQ